LGDASELAEAAGVKHLVLYHHDPDRSDDEPDSIQEGARFWFQKRKATIRCTAAFEGLPLEL
jgi:ribonuclease BN (tRNA processing enzyme)